jgi:hypothetical protein
MSFHFIHNKQQSKLTTKKSTQFGILAEWSTAEGKHFVA